MPKGRPVIVTLRQPEVKILIRAARVGMVVLAPDHIGRVNAAIAKLEHQLDAVVGKTPAQEDSGGD